MPLPMQRDGARGAGPVLPGDKPSKVIIEAEARAAAGIDAIHPVAHPETGLPMSPGTLRALGDEAGLRHEVAVMFGTSMAARVLADRLAAFVPGDADGDRHAPALMLATALRSVGIEDPAYAARVLDAAERGDTSRELFRLERLLAATAEGTSALAHLRRWPEDEAGRGTRRDALLLCSDLEAKGFLVGGHDSVDSVARALRVRPDARLDTPVGTAHDTPLQLLAQALVHCRSRQGAAPDREAAPPSAYPAYVAWKKGGFVESGPGTDFNRAIERMHKFLTYADRADHGPRTFGNLARDAAAQVRRLVGVGKSPLTQMRHGTLGGHKDLFHVETAKWHEQLGNVLKDAGELLMDEAQRAARQCNRTALHECLAKVAVAELWRETGDTTLSREAVMARARDVLSRAGLPAEGYRDDLLRKSLERFTKRTRGSDKERAVKVGMSTLEAIGAALRKSNRGAGPAEAAEPGTAQQEILQLRSVSHRTAAQEDRLQALLVQRRDNTAALIKELRRERDGASQAKPLFKWSDLKALLKGRPRNGPTAEDARQVMRALTSAPYVSMSTFADGASQGVGTFGSLALDTGLPLGVPLAYPVLQLQASNAAVVTAGVTNTGGRLFIGKQKARSSALGLGGGWSLGIPGVAKAVVAVDGVRTRSSSRGEGLIITARKDVEGWRGKVPEVVDFLFDRAAAERSGGAPRSNPARLWALFAERFGEDPHVALSWDREQSEATGKSASATVAFRGQVDAATTLGPALTAAYSREQRHYQRVPNADGADVANDVHIRTTTVSAAATLAQTVPAVPIAQGPVASWQGAVPLLGAVAEWDIDGLYSNIRIGRTRDGRLSPAVCHWEVYFQDRGRLVELIHQRRHLLERAAVEKDASGRTTPEQARESINTFLAELAALPAGHEQIHGEMRVLDPKVATRINRLEARMNTLLGKGDGPAAQRELDAAERAECRRIDNEVHRLLKSPDSWEPYSLWSLEFDQQSRSPGLNLGARVVHQEYARASHLTTLWLAGQPPAQPSSVE